MKIRIISFNLLLLALVGSVSAMRTRKQYSQQEWDVCHAIKLLNLKSQKTEYEKVFNAMQEKDCTVCKCVTMLNKERIEKAIDEIAKENNWNATKTEEQKNKILRFEKTTKKENIASEPKVICDTSAPEALCTYLKKLLKETSYSEIVGITVLPEQENILFSIDTPRAFNIADINTDDFEQNRIVKYLKRNNISTEPKCQILFKKKDFLNFNEKQLFHILNHEFSHIKYNHAFFLEYISSISDKGIKFFKLARAFEHQADQQLFACSTVERLQNLDEMKKLANIEPFSDSKGLQKLLERTRSKNKKTAADAIKRYKKYKTLNTHPPFTKRIKNMHVIRELKKIEAESKICTNLNFTLLGSWAKHFKKSFWG